MKKKICNIIGIVVIASMLVACGNKSSFKNDDTSHAGSTATGSTTEVKEDVTEQTEEETTEAPCVEPEIDIVMVGDILLHDNVQNSGKREDGSYNYDHLFAQVKEDIQKADIAIANQEVILGGTELGLQGYPTFNGAYEVGDALYNAGFNVILHATNHTLDQGSIGVKNCLNFWKKYPDVVVLGMFESQESYDNDIYVYEQDGIKVAILNYTYGTNGIPFPSDMPYATALLSEEKVTSDIKRAEEIADFTIVCPHWGVEYTHTQSENQEYWAKIFMENGADLVFGTHPHVVQPVELLTDENGQKTLVYYSVGNFINSTAESGRGTADRMIGAMAEVTLAKKEGGEVYIKEYGVEPLVTQLLYGVGEITTYKLRDYTKELALANNIIYKDSVFTLEWCKNLCRELFGSLYIE